MCVFIRYICLSYFRFLLGERHVIFRVDSVENFIETIHYVFKLNSTINNSLKGALMESFGIFHPIIRTFMEI